MTSGRRSTGTGLFVVLLPTFECNLACDYCFEDHPRGRWTADEAGRVLAQVFRLSASEGFDEVRLHWQGGEALLLGEDFWTRVLALAEDIAGEFGIAIDQRMQTNLTLYEPWLAPLARRHFGGQIGTSYDGTGERRTLGGGVDDFERRFWRAFREATDAGVEIGVLAVVRPQAIREGPAPYLARLRERGIARLRLSLPFATSTGRGAWLEPGPAGRFLAGAYRTWARSGKDRWMQLRPFGFLESRLSGQAPTEPGLCSFSGNCADGGLAVDPGGGVWLCDSCIGTRASYGNALSGELREAWRGAGRAGTRHACAQLVGARCLECRWLPVCSGGCLVRSTPDDDGALVDHYCDAYRELFHAVEQELAGVRASPPP